MLSVSTGVSPVTGTWRNRSISGEASSRGTSVQGRRSGEIMGITEEDEEEEDEFVEEVDDFKGALREGEFVEEEEKGPVTPPKR